MYHKLSGTRFFGFYLFLRLKATAVVSERKNAEMIAGSGVVSPVGGD